MCLTFGKTRLKLVKGTSVSNSMVFNNLSQGPYERRMNDLQCMPRF